jgi:flagellar motor switch protein FliG
MKAISPAASSTGLQKAAILMVLLGEDVASHVYQHLSESDLQRLTQRIVDLERIKPEIALSVLEEYSRLTMTLGHISDGGADYAKKLLVKAFGEDSAKRVLEQVTLANEMNSEHLENLQKADPQQLARFLEGEHPQATALIMAHLNTRQASALLLNMAAETRAEVIKRLAGLRRFSPEVAQKVSVALHTRLETLGEQNRRGYAGLKGAADVLNQMDAASGKAILESIERDDPEMALGIRNLMFTFEDLLGVPESAIRELLGQLEKKTLALALRGASEELRNMIFKAMSTRAVEMLKEDIEVLGVVRARDVSAAHRSIVDVARKLESEGKIMLTAESADEYIV